MTKTILKDFLNIGKYFLFPIFIFVFDLIAWLYLGLYDIWPWFDIPMHFLGGVAIGSSFFFSLNYFRIENIIKLNYFFSIFFVVSLVALIAVLWEFFWFLIGFFLPIVPLASLEDTLLDLALGLFGGLFMAIILEKLV